MLSRALSLATVMLLIAFSAIPVQAQNLEAGKTPSQIFSGTCTACHKGARGLLKTVAPGALPGFLRQHYTTSSEMASLLAAYLISNGATDTRYGGGLTKQGQDSRTAPKPEAAPEQLDRQGRRLRPAERAQEAARPDVDGLPPAEAPGRRAKRLPRPTPESPESAKPADTAGEPEAAGHASAKQKLGKRGKRNREEPKGDAAKDEPAKGETDKGEAARSDTPKSDAPKADVPKNAGKDDVSNPEPSKPSEGKGETAAKPESKPDTSKSEGSKSDTTPRPDPVPAVTPAPKASEGDSRPAPASSAPPTAPAAAPTEAPAAPMPSKPAPPPAAAPAPAAPAGPPTPPISQ